MMNINILKQSFLFCEIKKITNSPIFSEVEKSRRKIKAKDKVGIKKIINQKSSKKAKTKTSVIKTIQHSPISTDQREWRDLLKKLRQKVK